MKKALIVLFVFFPLLSYAQTDYKKMVDSLRYVQKIPYIENCDDPILRSIISKGKDIVPALIGKMIDTRKLKEVYVPLFGGEYTVADVAYIAIKEIVGGIPTFELLNIQMSDECGYFTFWRHIRESEKNRKAFQQAVREWYVKTKII